MIDDRFDSYLVEGKLGDGGLATVYRVRHTASGEPFALKMLDAPSPVDLQRLRREFQIQSRVRHPNVVAVHHLVEARGRLGLVMDLVDGPTLKRLLERRGPLSTIEVHDLGDAMLSGLAAVHRLGVVHRDLKPSNILLQKVGSTLVPRLTDFGMVRVLSDHDTRLTERFATLGTPMYIAPEQLVNSRDIDQAADIYAIGCILFEMASGRPPVEVRGLVDLFEKVTRGNRAHIDAVAPDLPLPMQRCIERALALDPRDRYGDAEEMRRAWLGFSQSDLSSTSFYTFEEDTAPTEPNGPESPLYGVLHDDEWDDDTNAWHETSKVLSRLARRDGRRELVETVERRLPLGRTRFQQRLIHTVAALVVFGGLVALIAFVVLLLLLLLLAVVYGLA